MVSVPTCSGRPRRSAAGCCLPTSTTHSANHCNLVYREEEREMIPQCIDMGVGVIPYSPLARGLLSGTRTRDGERRTVRAGNDPIADLQAVLDQFLLYGQTVSSIVVSSPVPPRPLPVDG